MFMGILQGAVCTILFSCARTDAARAGVTLLQQMG